VEAGDYAQALTLLEEIVRGDPDNADAWNYVGYSQRKLQRYAEAEESYKTALKIEPEHTGALEYLGELYLETDRPELARAQLQKLDKACFFGCEAYDELKEAIDSFEKHRQSS
jgi:Flp pilus assembly protein TadD